MLLPEKWQHLEAAFQRVDAPDRYGLSAFERRLLYATAIQSALRSNELRSPKPTRFFLDADPPFITCKAGSTKNKKMA